VTHAVVPSRGGHGHLHIECRADATGRTFLSQQAFRAPIHLSKPHWDGNYLVINVVNPTAGLFAGDHVEMMVRVCPGGRAVVTSPGAPRIFRAKDSVAATQIIQTFTIEDGGMLDVFPEMLIPHAGARCVQNTLIDVRAGGRLFFTEMIAPGRTAFGETFAYDQLEFGVDLVTAGHLALRERYNLAPRNESLQPLRKKFPHAYYASAYLVSQSPADENFQRAIGALTAPGVIAGASRASEHLYAIKLVAADSMSLRAAVARMRKLAYAHLREPEPILRKL
jgi:urease accessory protein